MKKTRNSSLFCLLLCTGTWCIPRGTSAQTHDASLPDNPQPTIESRHVGDGTYFDGVVTWKEMPGRFAHNQKEIWLSPLQLAKGRGWIPTLVVVGGTAGLIEADPHIMPYFRAHATNLDDLNDVFDQWITTGEVVALPVSLLGVGYARHDSYMTSTAMLAGEAYADSAVVDLAVKAVTRRDRPSDVPAGRVSTTRFSIAGCRRSRAAVFLRGTLQARFRWPRWLQRGTRTTNGCHGPRMDLRPR